MNAWMEEAREALMQRSSRLRARAAQVRHRGQEAGVVLSERDLQELRDIDEALARMKEGEFGRCSRCGGAIGRHRMRAIPETRYCLTCSGLVAR